MIYFVKQKQKKKKNKIIKQQTLRIKEPEGPVALFFKLNHNKVVVGTTIIRVVVLLLSLFKV